jgi:hypothetical protein
MSHARKQIRNAVATLLAPTPGTGTYQLVTQTRIDSSRNIWDYIKVFADGDTSERLVISAPAPYDRVLSLAVVGMLRMPGNKDTQTIEDKMEAMAAEIENKITNLLLLAALPKVGWIALTDTKMDVLVDVNDKIDHAELTMSWLVSYSTQEGLPETLL